MSERSTVQYSTVRTYPAKSLFPSFRQHVITRKNNQINQEAYGYVTNMNTNTGTASMKLLLSQGGFDNQENESLLEFTLLFVFFPIDGID